MNRIYALITIKQLVGGRFKQFVNIKQFLKTIKIQERERNDLSANYIIFSFKLNTLSDAIKLCIILCTN